MTEEPRWRQALCWGAVTVFFAVPLVFLAIQVVSLMHPGLVDLTTKEFKWMAEYLRWLSALVFGLAGLNSWDKRNGKK